MDEKEKNDLIDVHRQGRQHRDLTIKSVTDFFNCPAKDIFKVFKDYHGVYWKNILAVSFDDFLQKSGYEKIDQYGVNEDGYFFLKKEDIEVAPGIFKRCTTEGFTFLQKGSARIVLLFDEPFRMEAMWNLTLMYRACDESEALKFIEDFQEYATEHSYLKGAKIDPELHFLPAETGYTWDSVVLPVNSKQELITNVDNLIRDVEIYKKNNIKFKRGIILKGIPGTGKTLCGKVMCNTVACTFIWVTPKYLESARTVKFICDLARQLSPSILFLEDIDLYGASREVNAHMTLLGELMNQLDGLVENHYVIVIATTNRPDELEGALRSRPGRFDRVISIPPPDEAGRLSMFKLYLKDFILDGVDLAQLAKATDKYTGAHVKELVNTAVIKAIDERAFNEDQKLVLRQDHFEKNVERVRNRKIEATMGFGSTASTQSEDVFPLDDDDDE